MQLFEKFGEFDSMEELNMAAEGLKTEGDIESLKALAEENGIDPEDVEDYVDDLTVSLVSNPMQAAYGKLDVEVKANEKLYKDQDLIKDWIGVVRRKCLEDEAFARAVRSKGKNLKNCIAGILKWSFKNIVYLDEDLIKAAGVSAGKVGLGVPGMGKAESLIEEYYLG